jgi:hypothetical protein
MPKSVDAVWMYDTVVSPTVVCQDHLWTSEILDKLQDEPEYLTESSGNISSLGMCDTCWCWRGPFNKPSHAHRYETIFSSTLTCLDDMLTVFRALRKSRLEDPLACLALFNLLLRG